MSALAVECTDKYAVGFACCKTLYCEVVVAGCAKLCICAVLVLVNGVSSAEQAEKRISKRYSTFEITVSGNTENLKKVDYAAS